MPSRTYNLLAAGKPILAIAERGSEVELVIEEEGVGRCVEPGDVGAFVEAAIELMNAPAEELAAMRQRARTAALEKYSLEKAIEAYSRALV